MKRLGEMHLVRGGCSKFKKIKTALVGLFMLFFGAAVFCCAFLSFPDGGSKIAGAAENEPVYELYGSNYGVAASERGTMAAGNAMGYSVALNGTSLSLDRASSRGAAAFYRAFTAQITVPAHTAYAVDYTFNMTLSSSDPYSCTAQFELMYFGESINYNNYFARGLGEKSTSKSVCSLAATTLYPSFDHRAEIYNHPTVYYNNTTDTEKTFVTYFGAFSVKTAKESKLSGKIEISSNVSVLTQVDVPTLSATLTNESNGLQEYEETYSSEKKEFSLVNFDAARITANITDGADYLVKNNDKIFYTRAYDHFEITMSLPEGYCWNDEYLQGTGERVIVLKINKADPAVEVGTLDICEKGEFASSEVPMTSNSVSGTIAWESGAAVVEGENEVGWLFTPADENNYNTVSGQTVVTVGHDTEFVEKKDATCAETGIRAHYHCLRCGNNFSDSSCTIKLEDVTVPKLAHDYSSEITDPTCDKEGYTVFTCTKCGDTYTGDFEPALGHEYDVNDENSVRWNWTSTTIAKATFTCKRCGNSTQVKATIEKEQTDATCTTPGKVVYTAKVTVHEKEYTSQYIVENTTIAHEYAPKEWHWAEDYSSASVTYECTVCHDSATTNAADSKSEVLKDATCSEDGQIKYTVTVEIPNGDEFSDETIVDVPKTKHDLTYTDAVNASCTEDGNVEYWHCSLCDRYYGDEGCTEELDRDQIMIPASGHDYEAGEVVAPTAAEQGYTVYTCTNCGDSYHDDFVDPLGPVPPGGDGSGDGDTSGSGGGGNSVLDSVRNFFLHYWQPLVSGICIFLSIIFSSMIAYYERKRRKAKKQKRQYFAYSAASAGLFGFAYTTWSIIAYSLIGLTAVLLVGVIIAKVRSKKALTAMEAAARDYERNKAAFAENQMREEEKRQREEDRAEEKRRREEVHEARIAAMGMLAKSNAGVQPAPASAVVSAPAQPAPAVVAVPVQPAPAVVSAPVQSAPAPAVIAVPGQPVAAIPAEAAVKEQVQRAAVPPVATHSALQDAIERSELEQKLDQLRAELKDDHEHQDRVENFLAMISGLREQDRAKLREEEKMNEERKRLQDVRRAAWDESLEPAFVTKFGEEYYDRTGYGMHAAVIERERLREMGMDRALHEREMALREREVALREKELEFEREKRERDRYFYPHIPIAPPPYGQPVYQHPLQSTSRELELERELREKERLLLEKESARAHDLELELALERERVRNLMQTQNASVQNASAPQPQSAPQPPVVVVPPVVQPQSARRNNVFSSENPFSVNNRAADGKDD